MQQIDKSAVIAGVTLALPWLSPWSPGPSVMAVSILVAWTAFAGLTFWLAARGSAAAALRIGVLCAALASALAALAQYFGLAGPLFPWVSASPSGEAFANLRQRNQMATLLAMGLAVAMLGGPLRGWRLAAVVVLSAAAAASSSRIGLVHFVVVGIAVAPWERQPGVPVAARWGRASIPAALHVTFSLLLPGLHLAAQGRLGGSIFLRIESALEEGIDSCNSRWTLWSNVLHLIAQKPLAGWGWGELDYAHYATLYPGTRFCDILDNAHNLPLHLAVELGVPAAVLLCGGAVFAVFRARPWAEISSLRQAAWLFLLVIGVHSLVEYPLWYGPFQVAAVLSIGVLAAPSLQDRFGAATLRAAQLAGAVGVLVLCAFAVQEYWRVTQLYLPPVQRMAAWRDDPRPAARGLVLFRPHALFAELTTTPMTQANAAQLHAMAREAIHFSPEPKVIEILIDSAIQVGRPDEALLDMLRFRAAFPQEYAAWRQRAGLPAAP